MSGLLRGFGFGANKAKAGFGYPVSVPTGTPVTPSAPGGTIAIAALLLLLLEDA